MKKPTALGQLSGLTVIEDSNILPVLKYPTGYKDGNKLGRRKRNLKEYNMYVVGNNLMVHPSLSRYLKDIK